MGVLILPRRYNQQPQGVARLDRYNTLGGKLLHHLPLGGLPRDIVTGTAGTLGAGGALVANGYKGRSLRGTGSSARASIALDLSARSKITVAFWLYWDAFANDDALAMEFGTPNYSSGNGFLIDPNASGVGGLFLAGVGGGGAGGSNLVAFTRPSAATWHRITLAMDRTTGTAPSTQAWVDGVRQTVSTPLVNGSPNTLFDSATLYLLSRSGSSLYGTGNLQDLTIYDGVLTDGEARDDFQNPWQIFAAPPRRIWGVLGGAPTYSITAGAGSLTLTGNAITMRTARTLAAGHGVLALTWNGVDMRAGRNLAAAAGAMTLTGNSIQLKAERVLAAGASFLTLTGNSVGMLKGYNLAAGGSAMTLTGGSVDMRAARNLVAEGSALALTGNSINFEYTPAGERILFANGGALSLTRGSAQLVVQRTLSADGSLLNMSGAGIVMKAERVLQAQGSVMTLTGQPANLIAPLPPGQSLSQADIDAIAAAVWANPRAGKLLTTAKYLAHK